MRELDFSGVQIKAAVGCAVKVVADNRATQTLTVSSVNAQLVSTAGLGKKVDKCAIPFFADDRISRKGGLSVFEINHLSRTVIGIQTERKSDYSTVFFQSAIKQSHVAFFDGTCRELPLKTDIHIFCFGYQ